MNGFCVPTLGPEGFITDPSAALVKLFQQAFASDHSQSALYPKQVFSIQHALSLNPNNMEETTITLQEQFNVYLSRYFENVDVTVTDVTTDENSAKRTLQIDIIVSKDDKQYSLGAEIRRATDDTTAYFIRSLGK